MMIIMINQSLPKKGIQLSVHSSGAYNSTPIRKKVKKPAIGRYIRSPTFISNFHLCSMSSNLYKKKKKQFTSFPLRRLEAKHASSTHLFSFLFFSFFFFLSLSLFLFISQIKQPDPTSHPPSSPSSPFSKPL